MSIALDTLILFLFIIVPGIVFRRFYFQGEFTKQFNSKTLAHAIIASILPGLFIQYLTANIYQFYWSKIDGKSIKDFYDQLANNVLPETLFDLEILWEVLVYIGLMLLISFLLAEISWGVIRVLKVDRWFTVLRFRNHWNYYFNGEIKGFRPYKGLLKGKILEVRADILVRIESEEPRLYSGVVKSYTINNNHELEYVYITKASIYKKNSTTGNKRELKQIPGDVFIVNAEDIINLNLHYITIDYTHRYDLKAIFNIIVLAIFIWLLVTDYEYFVSNTLFKTILIKVFFVFYLTFLVTLIRTIFFEPKSKKRSSAIQGLIFIIMILSLLYYVLRYLIF